MSRVETPAEIIDRLCDEWRDGEITIEEFWAAATSIPAECPPVDPAYAELPDELTTASGVELTRVWPG